MKTDELDGLPRYNEIALFEISLNSKCYMVSTATHSEEMIPVFNGLSLITKPIF